MEITVRGRHGAIPEVLRSFAAEKAGHLGKYLTTITSIDVEVDRDGMRSGTGYLVDLTVATSGPVFRARAASADPHTAIDQAVERAERRIKEFKRRRSGRPLHSRTRTPSADMSTETTQETTEGLGLAPEVGPELRDHDE